MKYSLDTSSLIAAWRDKYPPDMFPPVWERLEGLIAQGDLRASEEVLEELKKKDDALLDWAKDQDELFIPTKEEIQREVRLILRDHKKLIDTRATRSSADPFVVALAKAKDAMVVTNEQPTYSPNRPHIPDVCDSYEIECLSMLDMLRADGFSL